MAFTVKRIVAAVAAFAALDATAQIENFSARNTGMGGAGVASSTYETAAGYNPALVAHHGAEDDFGFVFPSLTAEVSDQHQIADTLDDTTDNFDELEVLIDSLSTTPSNVTEANALKDEILADLAEIDGKPARLDISGLASITLPMEKVSVGFDARLYTDVLVSSVSEGLDAAVIDTAIATGDSSVLDNIDSTAIARGAAIAEGAITFAKEFDVKGQQLYFGVSPKFQRVETILYATSVRDFDSDDIDQDEFTESDSGFNLDLGAAWKVDENWMLGLALRNLISADYDTVVSSTDSIKDTYQITPYATIGGTYMRNWLTLTAEVDVGERSGFESIGGSQFARIGGELDAAGWAQLRAGYRTDLNEVAEDVFTLGFGLSPFDVVHFDITGMLGEQDTYGASAELRWTF